MWQLIYKQKPKFFQKLIFIDNVDQQINQDWNNLLYMLIFVFKKEIAQELIIVNLNQMQTLERNQLVGSLKETK